MTLNTEFLELIHNLLEVIATLLPFFGGIGSMWLWLKSQRKQELDATKRIQTTINETYNHLIAQLKEDRKESEVKIDRLQAENELFSRELIKLSTQVENLKNALDFWVWVDTQNDLPDDIKEKLRNSPIVNKPMKNRTKNTILDRILRGEPPSQIATAS